jgi:prolipoprotein diacylglyceryltransferase
MNPIVFKNGAIELHAFTAWIMLGVACGILALLLAARSQGKQGTWVATMAPWLDCALAGVIAGIVGARLGHVVLNGYYFAAHPDQITSLASGGLDWHGALLFGVLTCLIVATLRRIPTAPLLDALAIALPFGAIAGWVGSAAANAVYGLEVRTLADFPTWLVVESQDIYGITAPRLNLLPAGIVLALVVLFAMLAITLLQRFQGSRFGLGLTLFSLGMFVIDAFRADYSPEWLNHRGDQWFDLLLALYAILIFALSAFVGLRRSLVSEGAST